MYIHTSPYNSHSLHLADVNVSVVPSPLGNRLINYTRPGDTLLLSSHECIEIPRDPGCTDDKLGIRNTFPRLTCKFNNLYFKEDRFYYLSDEVPTGIYPFLGLTIWGDTSWRDDHRTFPLYITDKGFFNDETPQYEITRIGTMAQPSLDHFGHSIVETVLPVAVVLGTHFPSLVTEPIDLILTRGIQTGLADPLLLGGSPYFEISKNYHNSHNQPYCSANSEDVCLVRSFAAGMGGLCPYYNSAVTPFIVSGLRFMSMRNRLFYGGRLLPLQSMIPRLLLINKRPGQNRYISNQQELLDAIHRAVLSVEITVQIMDQLSVKDQLQLLQNHSIIFAIDGSSFDAAALYAQNGIGLLLGARETGTYSNHFHFFPALQQLFHFRFIHTITQGWEREDNIIVPSGPFVEAIQWVISKHHSSQPLPKPPFSSWHLDAVKKGLYEVLSDGMTNITHMNFNQENKQGEAAWPSSLGIGNLPPFDDPSRCSFP